MFAIAIIISLTSFLIFVLATVAYLVSVIIDDSDDDPAASTLALDTQDFSRTPVISPAELPDGSVAELTAEELRAYGPPCNCLKVAEAHRRRPGSTGGKAGQAGGMGGRQSADEPAARLQAAKTTLATSQLDDPNASLDTEQQLLQGAALLAGAAAVIAGPEEIQSAEMNSRLLKVCASQREPPEGAPPDGSGLQRAADEQAASQQQQQQQASEAAGLSSWHSSASAQKSIISGQLGTVVSKEIFEDFDTKEMELGGTALHWCKTRKSLDRLLKLGLPLDIVNKRQETALHVAVRRHKLQVLIGLLNHGANLESRNECGETPLILACKVNDIFAAQMLLIYDADFDAHDNQAQSARHHSAAICDRHQAQQQLPSAAHLILAMLNEIGAKRCARAATSAQNTANPIGTNSPFCGGGGGGAKGRRGVCSDGCAQTGAYNGNSYGRWPSFERESCYRRCLFGDLIEARRAELKAAAAEGAKSSARRGQRNSRILCMDGGGLRGVIICQIMIEMERYLKRPMLDYFDWVGGTSVGAFIACALSLGTSTRDMRRICFEFKDEVFSGGRPYNAKFLERVLKRTLGAKTRLSDVKHNRLAFATVLADRDPCQLKMFRNYKSVAQYLEAHGFSADHYDSMSGHTTVATSGRRNTVRRVSGPRHGRQHLTVRGAASGSVNPSPGASRRASCASTETTTTTTTTTTISAPAGASSGGKRNAATSPTADVVARLSEAAKALKTTPAAEAATLNAPQAAKESSEVVLDENERNPIVWQAVRASAAAPFFFRPYGPFLDGGIISNNPTIDILTEFANYHRARQFVKRHSGYASPADDKDFSPEPEASDKLDVVVSLGTGRGRVIGRQAMVDFGQIATGLSAVFSPVELVRSIRAARDLFKRLMQQSCHTDDHILDRAQAWCASLEVPYYRLNPPLATIFSIDDKRDEQLINAMWQTKLYMLAMKDQLQELADLLKGPGDKI